MPASAGHLTSLGRERCLLETSEQDLDRLAYHLPTLEVDFIVREPTQLVEHIDRMAKRLRRAVQSSGKRGNRPAELIDPTNDD